MAKFNVTVDLKEGMKIAPINEQDKKYTLILYNLAKIKICMLCIKPIF